MKILNLLLKVENIFAKFLFTLKKKYFMNEFFSTFKPKNKKIKFIKQL